MAVTEPPVELGVTTNPAGSALAHHVTQAAQPGSLVWVFCAWKSNGAAPTVVTDTRGNVYVLRNVAAPFGGTAIGTFSSILTAPIFIGDQLTPAWPLSPNPKGILVGAAMIPGGVAGFQQSATANGQGKTPRVITGTFTQDNSHVFLLGVEQNGQADTGYLPDDNITEEGASYPGGDAIRWGWVVPPGRLPMNFNPTFVTGGKWGLIADTFSAIDANLPRRISVGECDSAPAQPAFVPDDPALTHRLRVDGRRILDGRTGEEWNGWMYNHPASACLVPGMSLADNPLQLDDMALSKAAGAQGARIQFMWQNNSNPVTNFKGWIAGGVMTATTAPNAPICADGSAEVLVGPGVADGTKVTAQISVNLDGTGTYAIHPNQNVGSALAPVALTASPLYPPQNKVDAYNPNAPYLVDPVLLGKLDLMIAAAAAQGLWIILHFSGGNEGFWTDGVSIDHCCDIWRMFVARYGHYDKIAFWEPLSEPHPTQDPVDNDIAGAFYRQVIAAIRETDVRTPPLIGGASTYNICNLEKIVQTDLRGIVYTGNCYLPADYVKSTKHGTTAGWPSNPADPNDPVYPWYLDNKGGQRGAGGQYNGKGQLNPGNAAWMDNIIGGCADNFCSEFNVPFYCQQAGIRTDSIGGLQWAIDTCTAMRKYGFGVAWWCWRTPFSTNGEPGNGDIGMVGQLVDGGPWIPKMGTGAPGDTWGPWIPTLQAFMTRP